MDDRAGFVLVSCLSKRRPSAAAGEVPRLAAHTANRSSIPLNKAGARGGGALCAVKAVKSGIAR